MITEINVNGLNVSFKLQNTDYQVANRLRQVLLANITTLSIDTVNIITNDSINCYDEYLAHRLGLIPLKCDTDIEVEDVKFELNVHAVTEVRNVTTKDLISNSQVVPVDNDFLICKLHRGQSLHFNALVKYGTGSEHTKWSPITSITFKPLKDGHYFEMETLGTIKPELLIEKALRILTH